MTTQFLYRLGRSAMNLYSRLVLDMDIIRTAALPAGAKIIAPNHPTTLDPFLVPTYVDEQVHILITDSAFKVPGFGRYLHAVGHIPVVVGEGHAAFDTVYRLLCEGKTVAIFPEGALSPLDGGCGKPRTGVARLSMLTGAAIIPVGIGLQRERIRLVNTGIVNSEGQEEIARVYVNGRYVVTTGAPMPLRGDVEDRSFVRAASAKLMQQIVRLSDYSLAHTTQPATAYDTAELPSL